MSKYLVVYSCAGRVYDTKGEFTIKHTQYWQTFKTLREAKKFYKSLGNDFSHISSAGITKLIECVGYLGGQE